MKKIFILLMTVLLIIAMIPSVSADNSAQSFTVVISSEASDNEKYAAEIFSEYAGKIVGKSIPITDDESTEGYIFAIGNTALYDTSDCEDKDDGAYTIAPFEKGTAIYGAGERGTIYGVFGFLYDFCGYRCFTSSMGLNTDADEITLPTEKIEYNPYFEYTETDWVSPSDEIYSLINGLNGGSYRSIPTEHGGTVDYISNFCHTLTTEFCSAETYFDEHPEYFALHDGVRSKQQLCLTNPDTIQIVTDEVMALLEEKHNPNASVQIVSLTQNDSGEDGDFCQCESCKALDDENGSHAGSMINFVNTIAQSVKDAGYDNVAIDTFAYRYTRTCPTNIKPLDNVIVRLCTIECCFSHTLDDTSCAENVSLMNDLVNWGKICDRIYIWDYTTNYAYTCCVFPDFNILQRNIQIFYENGAKGVYEEGAYYVTSCDTEFQELRSYMISRFLRDPYCDGDEVITEFLDAYYGDSENMRQIIDMFCDNAASRHAGIYYNVNVTFEFSDNDVEKIDKLWEQASENVTDEQLARQERSEISWEYIKCSLKKGEYKSVLDGKQARIDLLNRIKDAGVTCWCEGGDFKIVSLYMFLPINTWNDGNMATVLPFVYIASWVIFGVSVLLLAIYLILLIKRGERNLKNIVLYGISPLIIYIASGILAVRSRRLYIDWIKIPAYVVTLVIFALFVVALWMNIHRDKSNLKQIIYSLIALFVFFCIYELPLAIINNAIYHGGANDLAMSVSSVLMSCFALVTAIKLLKK